MGTDPETGLSLQFDQAVGGYLKLHKVGYDTAVYRLSKSIPTFKRLESSLFRTGQVNKYSVAEIIDQGNLGLYGKQLWEGRGHNDTGTIGCS